MSNQRPPPLRLWNLIPILLLSLHFPYLQAAALPGSSTPAVNTTSATANSDLTDENDPLTCIPLARSEQATLSAPDCVAALRLFENRFPLYEGPNLLTLTTDPERALQQTYFTIPRTFRSGNCAISYKFVGGNHLDAVMERREISAWTGNAIFTCIGVEKVNAGVTKLDTGLGGQHLWIVMGLNGRNGDEVGEGIGNGTAVEEAGSAATSGIPSA